MARRKYKTKLASYIRGYLDYIFWAGVVFLLFSIILYVISITRALLDDDPFINGKIPVVIQNPKIEVEVEPTALPIKKPRIEEVVGDLTFKTKSLVFLIIDDGIALVALALSVYIVDLLRQLLSTVLIGKPFYERNSRIIRLIGFIAIGWGVLQIVGPFLYSWIVLSLLQIDSPVLKSPLGSGGSTIFIGLIVLVLSEVFRYGTRLEEDQSGMV